MRTRPRSSGRPDHCSARCGPALDEPPLPPPATRADVTRAGRPPPPSDGRCEPARARRVIRVRTSAAPGPSLSTASCAVPPCGQRPRGGLRATRCSTTRTTARTRRQAVALLEPPHRWRRPPGPAVLAAASPRSWQSGAAARTENPPPRRPARRSSDVLRLGRHHRGARVTTAMAPPRACTCGAGRGRSVERGAVPPRVRLSPPVPESVPRGRGLLTGRRRTPDSGSRRPGLGWAANEASRPAPGPRPAGSAGRTSSCRSEDHQLHSSSSRSSRAGVHGRLHAASPGPRWRGQVDGRGRRFTHPSPCGDGAERRVPGSWAWGRVFRAVEILLVRTERECLTAASTRTARPPPPEVSPCENPLARREHR